MMFTIVSIVWWTILLFVFGLIALNGGTSAWVGVGLSAILLALCIFEAKWGWGKSKSPHDWSV